MSFINRWKNKYFLLYEKSRLVSQITAFLIFVLSFLSLGDFLYRSSAKPPEGFWADNTGNIAIAVSFHILIAVVFFIRFVFLFFKSEKAMWLSQALWVLGVISIYSFIVTTRGTFFISEAKLQCMDCMYYETFLYASSPFVVAGILYYELTFLKQALYGIVSAVWAVRK